MAKRMSPEARKYLKEVWGYDTVAEVDHMTWECIEENTPEFPLDNELVALRDARVNPPRYL